MCNWPIRRTLQAAGKRVDRLSAAQAHLWVAAYRKCRRGSCKRRTKQCVRSHMRGGWRAARVTQSVTSARRWDAPARRRRGGPPNGQACGRPWTRGASWAACSMHGCPPRRVPSHHQRALRADCCRRVPGARCAGSTGLLPTPCLGATGCKLIVHPFTCGTAAESEASRHRAIPHQAHCGQWCTLGHYIKQSTPRPSTRVSTPQPRAARCWTPDGVRCVMCRAAPFSARRAHLLKRTSPSHRGPATIDGRGYLRPSGVTRSLCPTRTTITRLAVLTRPRTTSHRSCTAAHCLLTG